MGLDRRVGMGVGDAYAVAEHVLGERHHHRAGPAGGRLVEGVADELGDAVGAVDLDHPLRHLAEERLDVDLLEGLALAHRGRPGRGRGSSASSPCRPMWRPAEALVAPGPRVAMTTPDRPVSLPQASAIIAAPPSWRASVTLIGES